MPAAFPRSAQGGEEGRLVDAAQPRRQRVHVRRAQGGGDIAVSYTHLDVYKRQMDSNVTPSSSRMASSKDMPLSLIHI